MAEKLNQLLISENRVERIASELPKRTAVKVTAALKELRQSISRETTRDVTAPEETYLKRKDSYLMAPLIELKNNHEKYENALKSDISHHLLLVICEESISTVDEKYYEELVNETSIPKKVIVISSEGVGIKDDLKFTDFSNEFKKTLLSKQVSFQGTTLAVADLIKTRTDQTVEELIQSGEPEKNFNLESIEELIKQEKSPIQIPSLSSSRFEKSLYIKRQLSSVFPLDNEFWEEVAKQLDMETSGGYSLEKLQRECGDKNLGKNEFCSGEKKIVGCSTVKYSNRR
ncbi:hypothetical protein DAPPUDRAFT_340013 [Daphnia pulex]|uniref:Uncharacterized protein n=1 Tax=Daphnia pulex TaxID=6669 RepID=E9I3S1_DAPPU|nr:hypothetical protein DAPPUDRAFT_340013 [Daphnia pulex]|eukprot:EFX61358.1 hypothetical protein DAPPUDRAFT_340013 [Daphnia pulex]